MAAFSDFCEFRLQIGVTLIVLFAGIAACRSETGAPSSRADEASSGAASDAAQQPAAAADDATSAPPISAQPAAGEQSSSSPEEPMVQDQEEWSQQRSEMIKQQIVARQVDSPRVLQALSRVPRHEFVPANLRRMAYDDHPLPIGHDQTISQPYIVALMTQLVDPQPNAKALDVGTGSGYQAAVLAELVAKVFSIEIVEPLADEAQQRLRRLGYQNVQVRHGDGYRGWPEEAPFDVIVVAAAPDHVPETLVEQLAPNGKMVIPVGDFYQELLLIEKAADGSVKRRSVAAVAFVPMTGEAQQ